MIKIVAKMMVQESNISQFQTMAQELVEKSRAEEGNVSYSLNQNTDCPALHCFIEFWADQEALNRHNDSEHFTTILPKLAEMTSEAPVIEIYSEVTW